MDEVWEVSQIECSEYREWVWGRNQLSRVGWPAIGEILPLPLQKAKMLKLPFSKTSTDNSTIRNNQGNSDYFFFKWSKVKPLPANQMKVREIIVRQLSVEVKI